MTGNYVQVFKLETTSSLFLNKFNNMEKETEDKFIPLTKEELEKIRIKSYKYLI